MRNIFAAFVYILIMASVAYAGNIGPVFYNGVTSLLGATAISGNGTATSSVLDMRQFKAAAIQVQWGLTGATGVSGFFSVQGSVDYTPGTASSAHWSQLNVGNTGPSGTTSSGSALYDINATSVPWIEVIYTGVGGNTGTFTINASQKGP